MQGLAKHLVLTLQGVLVQEVHMEISAALWGSVVVYACLKFDKLIGNKKYLQVGNHTPIAHIPLGKFRLMFPIVVT